MMGQGIRVATGLLILNLSLAVADSVDEALDREERSQTATAITIIFDNSGSMRERDKLATAKRAFVHWLESLPEEYRLGLIHFNNGEGVRAVSLGEENRAELIQTVKNLTGYGRTPICDCLRLAEQQIAGRRKEHSPYERHVVVVFTDGAETVDRRLNGGVVKDAMALRGKNIEIVGIGFDGEGGYMRHAVTRYFQANNEEELRRGLAKVDAEFTEESGVEVTEDDLATMKLLANAPAATTP